MEIRHDMRRHVACVTPVYFTADVPRDRIPDMLAATLDDTELFVEPDNIVLVIDGVPWVGDVLEPVLASYADRAGAPCRVMMLEDNLGKGGAVAAAFEDLLSQGELTHFAIRDDDADHCIYDLPDLFSLSRQMADAEGTALTIANGRRVEIHRPLGMARGFMEAMLNGITCDAIRFRLAREGRALNTRWHSAYAEVPDLESGYKVYSRTAAEAFVTGIEAAQALCPDLRMGHFGVEIVPTTEVLLAGGVMGEMMRTTMQSQPVSMFMAGEKLASCFGGEATWLFRRLGIPADVADTLMCNAIARCGYGRSAEGAAVLRDFRSFILDRLGAPPVTRPPHVPERF